MKPYDMKPKPPIHLNIKNGLNEGHPDQRCGYDTDLKRLPASMVSHPRSANIALGPRYEPLFQLLSVSL
jgi:hypothetical protein